MWLNVVESCLMLCPPLGGLKVVEEVEGRVRRRRIEGSVRRRRIESV